MPGKIKRNTATDNNHVVLASETIVPQSKTCADQTSHHIKLYRLYKQITEDTTTLLTQRLQLQHYVISKQKHVYLLNLTHSHTVVIITVSKLISYIYREKQHLNLCSLFIC